MSNKKTIEQAIMTEEGVSEDLKLDQLNMLTPAAKNLTLDEINELNNGKHRNLKNLTIEDVFALRDYGLKRKEHNLKSDVPHGPKFESNIY